MKKSAFVIGMDFGFGDDETFMSVWAQARRNYIGKNNMIGRLRYWYHRLRGEVAGDLYFKRIDSWKVPK